MTDGIRTKVLSFVKKNGNSTCRDIAKKLNTTALIASNYLTKLEREGKLESCNVLMPRADGRGTKPIKAYCISGKKTLPQDEIVPPDCTVIDAFLLKYSIHQIPAIARTLIIPS